MTATGLPPDKDTILAALRAVIDPELGDNVVDLGMVRSVHLDGTSVTVEIALTVASCPLREQLQADTIRHVSALAGVAHVEVRTAEMTKAERATAMGRARRVAQDHAPELDLSPTTRVLAIVSGKGGVGKSSVTANLGVALAQKGLSVGILDGDISGFSIPRLLGVEGQIEVRDKKMLPKERTVDGGVLKVVSMGFLSGEDEAIMWRGFILNRALQHFLEDVAWGDLDYLLVDMPPGTGDIQMGLARMLPRAELLVVTTPALAAQKVAGRAADMARRGHLRICGVIENMSGFVCEHGEHYPLFGEGGGQRLADEIGVPLVASIPLDPEVALGGDEGRPAAERGGAVAKVFAALAERIVEEIAPVRTMTSCSARLVERVEQAVRAGI